MVMQRTDTNAQAIKKLRAHQVPSSDPDACWGWTGGRTKAGYGVVRAGARQIYAHRLSYQINVGPIPDGLWALHHCDNPPCTNPTHLFAGTASDNAKDRQQKGRSGPFNLRHIKGPRPASARFGTSNNAAKMTDEEILEIRRLYADGAMSQRALARRFGIHQSGVSRIISCKIWTRTS